MPNPSELARLEEEEEFVGTGHLPTEEEFAAFEAKLTALLTELQTHGTVNGIKVYCTDCGSMNATGCLCVADLGGDYCECCDPDTKWCKNK